MKKSLLIALSFTFVASCKKSSEKEIVKTQQDSLAINESDFAIDKIPDLCFVGSQGKDSVYLKITDNLGTITGQSLTKYSDKDSIVIGDIMGFKYGDTLRLEMISGSGDQSASKEIWFLEKKKELIEAVGKYDNEGRYSNPNSLTFDEGKIYKPTNCKVFDKK